MTEFLFLRWRDLSRGEWVALGVLVSALVAWIPFPPSTQPQSYHLLADRRTLAGIANAADVLSNLTFALVGAAGIALLCTDRRKRFSAATVASLWIVMLGLVATAAGSAWYHLDPRDATLVWDRLPMTLVFAGVLGAALAQRVGQRLARATLAFLVEIGLASVVYWHVSGNLSPYMLLQLGGIAALVLMLVCTRGRDDPFPWWALVGGYVLAKAFETWDGDIYRLTNGLVAGHALKHLAAAGAGAAMLVPLCGHRSSQGVIVESPSGPRSAAA